VCGSVRGSLGLCVCGSVRGSLGLCVDRLGGSSACVCGSVRGSLGAHRGVGTTCSPRVGVQTAGVRGAGVQGEGATTNCTTCTPHALSPAHPTPCPLHAPRLRFRHSARLPVRAPATSRRRGRGPRRPAQAGAAAAPVAHNRAGGSPGRAPPRRQPSLPLSSLLLQSLPLLLQSPPQPPVDADASLLLFVGCRRRRCCCGSG